MSGQIKATIIAHSKSSVIGKEIITYKVKDWSLDVVQY